MSENTVSQESYARILAQLEDTQKQNDILRGDNLFVGIRWYGDGGYAIGLAKPIRGLRRVTFNQGNPNQMAIINFEDWLRLDTTEEKLGGVIVRDDSIIDTLGIKGYMVGDADKEVNPNAFTNPTIENILRGTVKRLKEVMNSVTHRFAPKHFRRIAEAIGIDSIEKLDIIKRRESYLLNTYNYGRLHHHDLTQYCETNDIKGWKDMEDKEMVKAIVDKIVKQG